MTSRVMGSVRTASGASLAFPSLVFPIQGKNGGKGEGAALTGSELFVSDGDIYPAMDSVVRFTQALRVFARMIKRQSRAHPKKWELSRGSICVDLLLALSQIVPCCDGDGGASPFKIPTEGFRETCVRVLHPRLRRGACVDLLNFTRWCSQ